MKKFATIAAGALLLALPTTEASAAIDLPVPEELYITINGMDWAWASPCSPGGCWDAGQALDLSYQGTQGWRVAEAADFLLGPTAADFGTQQNFACASAYFTNFTHCDYWDGQNGYVWNMPGGQSFNTSETWVVRGQQTPAVPEPGTWAMMLLGFGAIGFAMRRRKDMLQLAQVA